MKKKLLLFAIVFIALFTITGCGSKNEELQPDGTTKVKFVDMFYKEPKGFSNQEKMDTDDYKVLSFKFSEDSNKSVNLYYSKNKDVETTLSGDKYEEVEINGIKWKVIPEEQMGDVVYSTYYYQYGKDQYTIELNGVDKYKEEFDKFMQTIKFE